MATAQGDGRRWNQPYRLNSHPASECEWAVAVHGRMFVADNSVHNG